MISVQNLTKNYGETKALDNVSFEIHSGEVFGFLGPNGAGKSTTMKIITGFLAPTEGSVKVDGIDIQDDSMAVRAKIGYLPETVPLYTDMKVYEYLDFVGAVRGIPKEKRRGAIKHMVDVCGLREVISKLVSELSKGYRQRAALAQAMIHNPDILILDEPTSGLDPNQIVEIRELIKRLGREKTVILSTHILPEVAATCSRVIIINQGRIVASGRTDELLSGGGGKEVVQAKIRGHRDSVREALSRHESVRDVKHLADHDDGVSSFVIEVIGEADPQEIVFKTVVANGWMLLEMFKKQESLEEVFRRLTRNE